MSGIGVCKHGEVDDLVDGTDCVFCERDAAIARAQNTQHELDRCLREANQERDECLRLMVPRKDFERLKDDAVTTERMHAFVVDRMSRQIERLSARALEAERLVSALEDAFERERVASKRLDDETAGIYRVQRDEADGLLRQWARGEEPMVATSAYLSMRGLL